MCFPFTPNEKVDVKFEIKTHTFVNKIVDYYLANSMQNSCGFYIYSVWMWRNISDMEHWHDRARRMNFWYFTLMNHITSDAWFNKREGNWSEKQTVTHVRIPPLRSTWLDYRPVKNGMGSRPHFGSETLTRPTLSLCRGWGDEIFTTVGVYTWS